jgi:hypothetical protein
VGDGFYIEWIFDPLLEVALPGDMEQVAGNHRKDDGQVTKVGGKNLLIKIFLRHAIVAFKIVGCGNPVPNPSSGRILLPRSWLNFGNLVAIIKTRFSTNLLFLNPPPIRVSVVEHGRKKPRLWQFLPGGSEPDPQHGPG